MPTRVWLAALIVVGGFCIALVRRRSFVLIVGTIVLASGTACAHAPLSPIVITRLAPPPAALASMVKVLCNGRWQGWATPYGSTYAVTAAHVISDEDNAACTELSWEGGIGKGGHFVVLKDAHAKPDADTYVPDYALLSSDVGFGTWAEVSTREPEPGELLWWRLLLMENVPSNAPGFFIGKDGEGSYVIEGTAWPGSSGSGVFDSQNKLIAVVNGYTGARHGRAVTWATPADQVFK
jgi:hypothetical protein